MCGRFTLSYREARVLAAELGVPVESLLDYKPRYNIAPTGPALDCPKSIRGPRSSAGELGSRELLDDRSQAGVQEHQRSRRDDSDHSQLSRGIQGKPVRRPRRWL